MLQHAATVKARKMTVLIQLPLEKCMLHTVFLRLSRYLVYANHIFVTVNLIESMPILHATDEFV